jgi:hypothetical protein
VASDMDRIEHAHSFRTTSETTRLHGLQGNVDRIIAMY